MLRLFLGENHSEKTTAILAEIKEKSGQATGGIYLLVPEQASHAYERRICEACGNSIAQHAKVVSFNTLYSRAALKTEGYADTVLDDAGRLLFMHNALKETAHLLKLYKNSVKKPALLHEFLDMYEELTTFCITPLQLQNASEQLEPSALQDKLHDLAILFAAYEALLTNASAGRHIDPASKTLQLADKLFCCDLLQDSLLYIDAFSSFTAAQYLVLEMLLSKAQTVTAALACDTLEKSGGSVFDTTRQTASKLRQLADKLGVPTAVETFVSAAEGHPDLQHLCAHLFSTGKNVFTGTAEHIHVTEAPTLFSEVEGVAQSIAETVRKEGCKYSDIAVIARDLPSYRDVIRRIFSTYSIPVFISDQRDILQNPLSVFAFSALRVLQKGFSYPDVMRYIKTGFTTLSRAESALLDTYSYTYNISGKRWRTAEPFVVADESIAPMALLSELKERLISPFEALEIALQDAKQLPDFVDAFYGFLQDTALDSCVNDTLQRLLSEKQFDAAAELKLVYDKLFSALEQIRALATPTADLTEFIALLKIALSSYSIAPIPTCLDMVSTGDGARERTFERKYVYIIGVNQGKMPYCNRNFGILSPYERELLAGSNLTLSGISEALSEEQFITYAIFSLPKEQLHLSYSLQSSDGGALHPSYLLQRVFDLFSSVSVEKANISENFAQIYAKSHRAALALEGSLPSAPPLSAAVFETCGSEEDSVYLHRRFTAAKASRKLRIQNPEVLKKLFGGNLYLTASRLDSYANCRFSYYAKFTLRLQERTQKSFSAPEIGMVLHRVLEAVTKKSLESGGISAICEAEVLQIGRESLSRALQEYLPSDNNPEALTFLFSRLVHPAEEILKSYYKELCHSSFRPLESEFNFAAGRDSRVYTVPLSDQTALYITGQIDRVDTFSQDGKLFVRVLDYKSGNIHFDFKSIANRLSLQALLYLFTITTILDSADKVVPAGALYVPIHAPKLKLQKDATDEAIAKARDAEGRAAGVLLSDISVLQAMEDTFLSTGKGRFLPVDLQTERKTGELKADAETGELLFSSASQVLSEEEMGAFHRYLDKTLADIAEEIKSGSVAPNPIANKSCSYCRFLPLCEFDPRQGDRYRSLTPCKYAEFVKEVLPNV